MSLLLIGSSHAPLDVLCAASLQTFGVFQQPARGTTTINPQYKRGFDKQGSEIVNPVDAFLAECRQARYWYLKGALQQSRNLEIESDKKALEDYVRKLGFSDLMVGSLNAAEQLFKDTSNSFELKSCLGHLRSFLEHLHIEACPRFAKPGEGVPGKWGPATLLLRNNAVISQKDEAFITALYTLVSDEAIHPLIADREYARLFRNIVIEYGLLFLTALQKQSVAASGPKPNMGTST
jgi:hypothetical protein